MLLAAALRNRLAACLAAALALLAAAFWALFHTPLRLLPVVSGVANLGLPGSDILPRGPSPVDVAQRAAVLALGAGLLTTAAARRAWRCCWRAAPASPNASPGPRPAGRFGRCRGPLAEGLPRTVASRYTS